MPWKFSIFSLSLLSALVAGMPAALAEDPPKTDEPSLLPVAELKHPKPVDFQREVLPILKKNCLACHNTTDAEAKLILETPQTILKGGENGSAVVPKNGAESLLLVRARGGGDGMMPPEDNKVAALPLKPEELGLIKLWIDQGATGSVQQTAEVIRWQPLPPGVNPVYALALTEDGQYIACGRANQIFIYQVPTGRLVCRLSDPALIGSGIYKQQGVADLDLIQSLAFSPDGLLLASGGYRDVKLWRRPRNVRELSWADRLGTAVQTLAVSPDAKLLATAGADNTIKIWDLADGKELQSLSGHSDTVTGLVFAPDTKLLVSGGLDKTVRVWRLPEGTPAGTIDTPAAVQAVALVAGGNLLASGEADGRVRIWNNPTTAKPADVKKADAKDAKAAEAKGADAKAAAPPAVKPVRELAGHAKAVSSLVTLNKAPTQIVSAGEDGIAILWDAGSGRQIRQYKHGGPIAAVAVRADDQRVATAGRDKVSKLWNLADAKLVAELRGDLRARARMAALERQLNSAKSVATAEKAAVTESEKAATAEADNVKKSIDAKAAAEKSQVEKTAAEKKPLEEKAAADKAMAEANAAATKAAEGKKAADEALTKAETAVKVAAEALQQAKAALRKDAKNKQLAEVSTQAEKTLSESKTKAAEAKKVQNVAQKAATDADSRLKQATAQVPIKQKASDEAKKVRETAELAVNTSIKALAAAEAAAKKAKDRVPAAQEILAAAEAAVKQAERQLADGKQAATDTDQPLRSVAFSSDNQQLATGNEAGLIHTWSADKGLALEAYEGHHGAVGAIAFAGDRRLISGAADQSVMVWDTQPDWVWVRTLGASGAGFVDRVTALDFSPDGKLLATGGGAPSRSGELKIWDSSDGRLLRDLPDAHSDTVFGVAFSPDGKQLASCGADKFVKVFDVLTGKFVRAFEGHTHHVLGISWESDGKVLVSCGADNAVKVWDLDTGEQRRTITTFGKEVTSIHFVGDTINVLGTSGDRSVRLLRTTDGGVVKNFGGAADYLYCGGATPDGKIIVASGQDSVLRVWSGETGQTIRNFDPPPTSSGK